MEAFRLQESGVMEFVPDPSTVKYNPDSRYSSRHFRPRKATKWPGNSGKCSLGTL